MTTKTRELKYGAFEWDDKTRLFTIRLFEYDENGEKIETNKIVLSKTYAFSFQRFMTSMSQRNWFKKKEKYPGQHKLRM